MANVIITPYGQEWAVQAGNSAEIELFHTQHEAIVYAEERAKVMHSYILMQNETGELDLYDSHVPNSVPDEKTMDDTYTPQKKRKNTKIG